jgi:serine/threonine protein kinase
VTEHGLVSKVADFGVAKLMVTKESGIGNTRSGVAMGTAADMAPEQMRNAKTVDLRADIFARQASLGARLVPENPALVSAEVIELRRRPTGSVVIGSVAVLFVAVVGGAWAGSALSAVPALVSALLPSDVIVAAPAPEPVLAVVPPPVAPVPAVYPAPAPKVPTRRADMGPWWSAGT